MISKKQVLINVVLFVVLLVLLFYYDSSPSPDQDFINHININSDEIKTTSDGTKYIVDPDKIRRGIARPGNIKDVIPSIDSPKYISVEEADEWIEDNELVLAFEHKGVKRVYPLQILVSHEIVNDFVANDPILITYCPLCGSGIAYERTIDGETVEFGTSGKLYNSNLIMYDRKTETYWQQIDGKAILGPLTGLELTELSIDTVAWREYKDIHADAEVLSKDTGFVRDYGNDPYGSYYEDSYLIFPVENEDNRIHPKTPVVGIEIDGMYKAYKVSDFEETPIIEDNFNGVNIKLEKKEDGIIVITNTDTNEEIVKEGDFWFAWYAFHPETELYEGQKS
jgi:hypothetical protein